jgi:hypothetical protein
VSRFETVNLRRIAACFAIGYASLRKTSTSGAKTEKVTVYRRGWILPLSVPGALARCREAVVRKGYIDLSQTTTVAQEMGDACIALPAKLECVQKGRRPRRPVLSR